MVLSLSHIVTYCFIAILTNLCSLSLAYCTFLPTSWRSTYPRRGRHSILCALRINIHIRGRERGGEKWIEEGYDQYAIRLRPQGIELRTIWHKTDAKLLAAISGKGIDADSPKICLDVLGKEKTSPAFSELCFQRLEQGGSRLCFVIGGAEGLPDELRPGQRDDTGIDGTIDHFSLSRLTFTHQMARVLLAEQIYRAAEIRRGSGYHKQ